MLTMTCPCGKSFTARRSDARFCSSTCRSAAHQGRLSVVRQQHAPDSGLVAAVKAELGIVGVLDTPLGLAAVELAQAMGPGCPPAALPRLARQLEDTLLAAKRARPARSAPNVLRDELARRRAAAYGVRP